MKGTGQQPFNPMMNRPNTLGNKPQSSIQQTSTTGHDLASFLPPLEDSER